MSATTNRLSGWTYHAYGQSIVGHVVGPKAHDVTVKLVADQSDTVAGME